MCFILFDVVGADHVVVGAVWLDTERGVVFFMTSSSQRMGAITPCLALVPRGWDIEADVAYLPSI